MKTFGIIGTAGRGSDIRPLADNEDMFWKMRNSVRRIIQSLLAPNEQYAVVSGGAAWGDHLAVSLFLHLEPKELILHLPCEFKDGEFKSEDKVADVANHYHRLFSDIAWQNSNRSLTEIEQAIEYGATVTVSHGFFTRNVLVARDADYLIALTFGNKDVLKDGGTSHTMGLFHLKKDMIKSFHVDLHDFQTYTPAKVI
jgi:hypothetical protein